MPDETCIVRTGNLEVRRFPTPPIQILRMRGYDEIVLDKIDQQLNIRLPRAPNQGIGDDPRILSLAPGEWMLIGRSIDPEVFAAAAAAAGTTVMHLADVGSGRVGYAVTGPCARDLIAKGCAIDLHPRAFAEGRCVQSSLAQIFIVLDKPPEGDAFHVYAEASYEQHLDLWFADAAIEFRFEDAD